MDYSRDGVLTFLELKERSAHIRRFYIELHASRRKTEAKAHVLLMEAFINDMFDESVGIPWANSLY